MVASPMRMAMLAGVTPSDATLACYRQLDADAPDDYRQLAALLVARWRELGITKAGLGGGQGAGKSTLARLIAQAGDALGVRVQVLSIDDFYRTKAERRKLAADVHPLLATRGPPGTHAVDAIRSAMRDLLRNAVVRVPCFDKGLDDRSGHQTLRGPADIVVLEGWCVGASPCADGELATPINPLEREEDADCRWRRHVDSALSGSYAALYDELEALVFLRVPGLGAVRRWRLQQEQERPPAQRMSAAAVDRFVQYYERITRRMLAELPHTADAVVGLDQQHRVSGLRFRS